MDEQALRGLIADVKAGKLSRRAFVHRMVALGLTAPMASQMLTYSGVAQAQTRFEYKPTKRGGGGPLKVLWWQGADAAQSAFRGRHQGPGRLAHLLRAARRLGPRRQPRAGARRRDPEPRERRPRRATASRSPGSSRRACSWHDGKPFTADDVRVQLGIRHATRRPPRRPSAATRTSRSRRSTTTRSRSIFEKPTPFWADAFVGARGMIIPKHLFDALQGRQVARGADQPEAGRHRPLQVRRLQAGRHGARRDQPELPHAEPAATSTRSR